MTTTSEQARLAALHEYQLLDAPAGDELEAVVRVAATVAGVPTATLNLIDENRQCQVTTTGFVGGISPRADAMCAVHFERGDFVHRADARQDPAFAANPWVTGEYASVRFYASVPLVTPQGHALGSLCVFHDEPRELTTEQAERLRDLAGVLLALFERRRQGRVNGELVGELRRSNAELAQFAAVVSHDLAAPLSVVNGYLEVLDDRIGPVDPQAGKWIGAAGRAVGRMQRLITSLLSYAQAGNAPCRTEPARLGDLVEQALTDLRPVLGDAVVVVPAGLPELDCDPTLIRQLLQNLIGNAVKHRYPDRPCRVGISVARAGAEWCVTIADNGPGIPAGQRDRVFEMFTQVDPSAGTGHGVGLSTCQRIVERHNGWISATESPGGGATITFSLPAVLRAATAAAA